MAPHRRALHVHCYRMLGSLDDADDALQEAQLLAWRSLTSFEGRAPLRHWLYRITTTTTCLKLIRARGRVPLPASDLIYLQPYPDRLLDQLTSGDTDPAAAAERRDSVALAFIVALQPLPATQRAALILRDVLAYSPAEAAQLLETSVAAANSRLQRARATLSGTGAAERRGLRWTPPTGRSSHGSSMPGSAATFPAWRRCWPRTRSCGCRRSAPSSSAATRSPASSPPSPPADGST
jgi:RNA polymerase sigma-70 factor, ECF subfamily